mgnify:CR=1 FL=1
MARKEREKGKGKSKKAESISTQLGTEIRLDDTGAGTSRADQIAQKREQQTREVEESVRKLLEELGQQPQN